MDFAVSLLSMKFFLKKLRKQCIQLDDQQKINHKNPLDLPSAKYKTSKITVNTVYP